jgi:hypothetical protein
MFATLDAMSRVVALLGLAVLPHAHVVLAEADSAAPRKATVADSVIRWQFDTGG